jgi:hypothetical protein
MRGESIAVRTIAGFQSLTAGIGSLDASEWKKRRTSFSGTPL